MAMTGTQKEMKVRMRMTPEMPQKFVSKRPGINRLCRMAYGDGRDYGRESVANHLQALIHRVGRRDLAGDLRFGATGLDAFVGAGSQLGFGFGGGGGSGSVLRLLGGGDGGVLLGGQFGELRGPFFGLRVLLRGAFFSGLRLVGFGGQVGGGGVAFGLDRLMSAPWAVCISVILTWNSSAILDGSATASAAGRP